MDFLKRERPLSQFRAALSAGDKRGLRDWDLLLVDEAHNAAPSGRSAYVRDSDRTTMLRELMQHFDHRLFLTATPHNGYTESFTALLEMLDPLRFSRGPDLNRTELDTVMVRRLKDDLVDELGRRRFPKRDVTALHVALSPAETALFEDLDRYIGLRLTRASGAERTPVAFALTLLKKRLLSCPLAFRHSIDVHHAGLSSETSVDEHSAGVVHQLEVKLREDFDDDDEKGRTEDAAISESAGFFRVNDEERRLVERLRETAMQAVETPDAKARVLLDWVRTQLAPDQGWNDERLLVFTEYRHTQQYLVGLLEAQGWGDRVLTLYGGMASAERERVKAAFSAAPERERVRILVATDAASEGLNLQAHCRLLVHYEIPWNPNKMEQRNGRIDRHGQPADTVRCLHFAYQGRQDQHFLDVVVEKVVNQRADLGAVGDVIAAQVEMALRGERRLIETPDERRKRARAEVRAEVVTAERIRDLRTRLTDARRIWNLYPDTLRLVLHEALLLAGHESGLEPYPHGDLAGKAWLLRSLPPSWREAHAAITDARGRLLPLVFDEALARGREGVALVHLDHPLLVRALGVFRANLWAEGLHATHRLHRASYRVLLDQDLPQPLLVLLARLIVSGPAGRRLHEEILPLVATFESDRLHFVDDAHAAEALALSGTHPTLPPEVTARVRVLFPAHERQLRHRMAEVSAQRDEAIVAQLEARGEDDVKAVLGLIEARRNEINRTVEKMRARMRKIQDPDQFKLGFTEVERFDSEEMKQFEQDMRWLQARRDRLTETRATEPPLIRARYVPTGPARAFPLGLIYLLPERMVAGGRP